MSFSSSLRRCLLLAALMFSLPAAADSMRCGKWIVNESASPRELTQKCGEPQQRDKSEEDVYAMNANGRRVKAGKLVTERWIYQRSSRSLPMAVTIVDGKITRIERVD